MSLQHVVIGTSGHIDHGKTALVKRLTGMDTDRLPEEKRRGISIDLGFAHWTADGFQFAVVDVPGHERFVKNMVAGATGIDLGLLVVAADDGVMPQTREHLEIMHLLGVRTGLAVITKIDLVEPEYVELVKGELAELVQGTFLEGCPIFPVSCVSGAGVAELKTAIHQLAREFSWPAPRGFFRMPIDRVFSVEGHGTVVTGTVLRGEIRKGDAVELLPAGQKIRVRSVQNHGIDNQLSGARQRTAVNLAGVKWHEVSRGHELSSPGFARPSRRLLVSLATLATSPVLRNRALLQLHIGTSETPARVLLSGPELKPHGSAYAALRVEHDLVSEYGQRFVIRCLSPKRTVGGGRVLDPLFEPRQRVKDVPSYGAARESANELVRLSHFLRHHDPSEVPASEAEWRLGIAADRYATLVQTLAEQGELLTIRSGESTRLIHKHRFGRLARAVFRKVTEELDRHRPLRTLPRTQLSVACLPIAEPNVVDSLLEHLIENRQLRRAGGNLGLADDQVSLTRQQASTQTRLIEAITLGGIAPPTVKELSTAVAQKPKDVEALLLHAVEDGLVVRISPEFFLTPAALAQAHELCRQCLKTAGPASMSQLRQAWGISRKYAQPLCEYFDAQQITIRMGDLRSGGPRLEAAIWDCASHHSENGACLEQAGS